MWLTCSIVEAYTFDFTYSDAGAELAVTTSVKDPKSSETGRNALRKIATSKPKRKTEGSASNTDQGEAQISQESIYRSLKVRRPHAQDQVTELIIQRMMRDILGACREMNDLPSMLLPSRDLGIALISSQAVP